MKPSIIAAFVASFVALALAMRKRQTLAAADANRLYAIDEYIGNEEL
ncbi:MAG TPA: hypothetical protein VL633_01905 [Bacteroidota bacterium]|nr:hypothetical protein [Bacteroidota bacterium]